MGQGDAAYIRAPGGRDMLIDSGSSDSVLERLDKVMPRSDREIDLVVETHPDADHIGGLPAILQNYEVGRFIEPGIESKNSIDDLVRDLLAQKGVPHELARRGAVFDLGEAQFKILFPDEDVSGYRDTNDASIVGRLVYGSTTVIFTGDAGKKTEDHVLDLGSTTVAELKSDLLKVGHHGSKGSSGIEFLRAVNPTYAVISSGQGNRYGHPHKEVLERLDSLHIRTFRTDDRGTIEFTSDGLELRLR